MKFIGCDGYGRAFNCECKTTPKKTILENYTFALCPENSIGDGYVTEKIPEAFHSGCIPITWCRPQDLEEDFNPGALINLYGLSEKEIKQMLFLLVSNPRFVAKLRSIPLLKKRPSIEPLIKFIIEK
jgi:hypothetical protein